MSLEHSPVRQRGAPRLLSWAQLLDLVPYSRQHIAKLIKQGAFPAPVMLGPARPAFIEQEIAAHLAALPREVAAAPKNDRLEKFNAQRREKR